MKHDFYRQSNNPAALINKDKTALEEYKARREILRKNSNTTERLDKLEEKMNTIQDLLVKFLEGQNK